MKLIVVVTGLVLMVPDSSSGRLHLLFPEDHHGHTALVAYRGIDGPVRNELRGFTMDLSHLDTGSGSGAPLVSQVFNFGAWPTIGADPAWLKANHLPGFMRSRITLPLPRRITPVADVPWRVAETREDGRPGRQDTVWLTHQVVLEYSLQDPGNATLTLQPAQGSHHPETPLARPYTGGESVVLMISNLPTEPNRPLPTREATHFQAYARLFRNQPGWLRLFSVPEDGIVAGSPYNCMLAWAPIKP